MMFERLCVFFGTLVSLGSASEPFIPTDQSLPFLVYYTSRYRGMCMGQLVARSVILSAAVCVINPYSIQHDRRPVTVVVGASYRHPGHGIRICITHIVIPKMPLNITIRANLLQRSPAVLMMKRKVPDVIAEVPVRALDLDWCGEVKLRGQQECFFAGWHFFYKKYKSRSDSRGHKSKLLPIQRNVMVQFVRIVKTEEWCAKLARKLEQGLIDAGFHGQQDRSGIVCVKDGMYGAPLVCSGRAVGMLTAPDAQWHHCSRYSNLVHLYSGRFIRAFMQCVSKLFDPDFSVACNPKKKEVTEVHESNYDDNNLQYHGVKILADDDAL